MKVLNINQWDIRGGSARASMRIHNGLLKMGVDSKLAVSGFCLQDHTLVPGLTRIAGESLIIAADACARKLQRMFSIEDMFYPSSSLLLRRPFYKEADIIQLYGLHGGYFALPVIKKMAAEKPVFWRLSDMWPFTGHCVYAGQCEKWQSGCGSCPVFKEYPYSMWFDTTAFHWRMKKELYKGINVTILAPSKWIYNLAKASPLLKHWNIELLPNGVDIAIFKPVPKTVSRSFWNLPENKGILVLSSSVFGDPRKGSKLIDEIMSAVGAVVKHDDMHVLMIGKRYTPFEQKLAKYAEFTPTGLIEDQKLLSMAYSAGDVLLHPAIEENLSNSVMESMASGTTVACFDVGGLADVVTSAENGCAAKRGDVNALTAFIAKCLQDRACAGRLGAEAALCMQKEYSAEGESTRLAAMYRKQLTSKS